MTEKTDKCSAEVYINEDYDTGETTITLTVFKNKELDTAYVLDSVVVYEKTRSRALWKATEKETDE